MLSPTLLDSGLAIGNIKIESIHFNINIEVEYYLKELLVLPAAFLLMLRKNTFNRQVSFLNATLKHIHTPK